MDNESLTLDSKTHYHSLATPAPHRKNPGRKKLRSLATSTPAENKINQKSEQSSFLSCIESRLSKVFKEIQSLNTSWVSTVSRFCSTFTELTTHLTAVNKRYMLPANDGTFNLWDLFENSDLTEQAQKLHQGRMLEKDFDKLSSHLQNLNEVCTNFANLIKQLSAMSQLGQKGDTSIADDDSISGWILWPALLGEAQGLYNCLQRDLRIRTYLVQTLVTACATKEGTLKTASMSWHLTDLVNWNPILEIIQHLTDHLR